MSDLSIRNLSYNTRELLLWLIITSVSMLCLLTVPNTPLRAVSFLVMTVAFNLAMGNLFCPRPEGYVYWPLYRWLRKQRSAYITSHNGQAVLARDEGLGEERLYTKDGIWIGSWFTNYELNLLTLLDLQQNQTPIPSSIQFKAANEFRQLTWLARLRSPKLPAGNTTRVRTNDGTVVGQTPFKFN
jgi:hypothetical protein